MVHNSGQDSMTFFVSQAQPGLGRCYLKTSLFASGTIELSLWALLCFVLLFALFAFGVSAVFLTG